MAGFGPHGSLLARCLARRPHQIRPEPGAAERARVIGSLTGEALQILLEAVNRGVTVLDLSGIDEVDDSAVHLLASLSPERCTFVACPRWLELWLASVRG
jgi:hypothetical protein